MRDINSLKNEIRAALMTICAGDEAFANSIANGIASAVDNYCSKLKVSLGIPVNTSGGSGATTSLGNIE
jgi:hypothetical protein